MTYAQKCRACKEVFVLQERSASCPSCAAPMPKPKVKTTRVADKFSNAQTVLNSGLPLGAYSAIDAARMPRAIAKQLAKDICKNMTHEEWRKLEPKKSVVDECTSDVIAEFLQINEEIASLYSLLYGFMSKNTELIKSPQHGPGNASMSNETMCDFGFFCREAENTLDELRKEVKARKELCGQTIALRKMEDSLSDPNIKLNVKGQYATGSPDVKMQAKLPKKFTDEYYQITDYFNVPREVAATGVLRIDWKASGDFLTQLANDGHKSPDGFGKQYPTYVTTFRRRRQAK